MSYSISTECQTLLMITMIKARPVGWLVHLLTELGKEHPERDFTRDSIYW